MLEPKSSQASSSRFCCCIITMLCLLSIVALLSLGNQQVEGYRHLVHHDESLATGFDISRIELESSTLNKGKIIFKPFDPSCFKEKPLSLSERDLVQYQNTASLVKSFGLSADLTPSFFSLFSLKTSLGGVYKRLSQETEHVSGATLRICTHSRKDYLDRSCEDQAFDGEFEADFKMLDKTIKYPHELSSWEKYQHFLDKYGSHYVYEVTYGASINQHTFAKSSLNYSEDQFSLKACLELAGPVHVGVLGVKGCGTFSKGDQKSLTSLQMSSKLVVMGGSDSTRNKIVELRSAENIELLMNEGRTYEAPVLYKFKSIPDMLKHRFLNTKFINQAANLKSYLEGYLNFGCCHKKSNTGHIELQKFEHDKIRSRKYPQYICTVAPDGCRHNSDCHIASFRGCRCNGDTCVQHKEMSAFNGKNKTIAAINKDGSVHFGGNCSFSPSNGSFCRCKAQPLHARRIVWSSVSVRKRGNTRKTRARARAAAHFKY